MHSVVNLAPLSLTPWGVVMDAILFAVRDQGRVNLAQIREVVLETIASIAQREGTSLDLVVDLQHLLEDTHTQHGSISSDKKVSELIRDALVVLQDIHEIHKLREAYVVGLAGMQQVS